nr:protein transport protein sec31 [Quercus suber]
MVRLREIPRTAVFAWSPGPSTPLLVTGTRTGAVSDDFSSDTKLELWDLGLTKLHHDEELTMPIGSITTDAGFNDIAWGEPDDEYPLGVVAGALENGSIDLWDVDKLRQGSADALISRTTKHSGAAKALQWNPWRHNLLASVGAKGEIFIYDLNNMANPFRLGASAARADDIECLDWNKQEKTAHILATGSSGGFVTVWDVKQKRDILTLNNQGRKAVSAVAWDPEESTKLATATPNDQEALINLWSLRNSAAPERTLKGHELGVLGLSWCIQDSNLLLSCGKDNRTICWNSRTGEKYGDFAAGSNWAFQTKWNPHNPNLIASASFDGKILVTSIQATNTETEEQINAGQNLDGEDFFNKAQSQPQSISFSLPKAPKWAARPTGVSFGFGGKLVRLSTDASRKSKVSIEAFTVDSKIGQAAEEFETKLRSGDLASICNAKIEAAKTDEEKADWRVIETLHAGKSRKKLREYIGFPTGDAADELARKTDALSVSKDAAEPKTSQPTDDDIFGNGDDGGDAFLANLASTKGAKTNSPFHIYKDTESNADKSITRALMLGQFEKALDICLEEDRMSDAFMIAVCGGQACIDKAQTAYLKKKAQGPNYLRLLASIVGKNLWDVVHNADLHNWKEVMATLCTYADETEFADLCEALGDRLEEAYEQDRSSTSLRRDASFCYLAGSKLEKVVNNWVQELQEQEKSALEASESDNDFSVHAQCLQGFIEKVSIFRKVTNFQDAELQTTAGWKLAPLYALYAEYANVLASHDRLGSAEQYLTLLPPQFEGADSAQSRIRQATASGKKAVSTAARQPLAHQRPNPAAPAAPASLQPANPLINQARNPPSFAPSTIASSPYAPAATPAANPYAPPANNYAPTGYQPAQPAAPYGPAASYGGYQPPQQQVVMPPPPHAGTAAPSAPPPSAARNMTNWNDMPEGFIKERQPASRRGTPGPQPVISPFPNTQPAVISPPPAVGAFAPKPSAPLPPPPRAGEATPKITSPTMAPPASIARVSSPYTPAHASQLGAGSTLPAPVGPPLPRGASPYQPPPSVSAGAPSNRYAPAPGSQPSPGPGALPPQRNVAPNPYSAQPNPYAPQQLQQPQAPAAPAAPPPRGPPRGPPPSQVPSAPPPRAGFAPAPPPSAPAPAAVAQQETAPSPGPPQAQYPRGDRSHISPHAQPIVDILSAEMARIKPLAPQSFTDRVTDTEKRLNILFDHLNNENLLKPDTVQEMVEISRAVERREWDRAQAMFTDMQTAKLETEGSQWMVSPPCQLRTSTRFMHTDFPFLAWCQALDRSWEGYEGNMIQGSQTLTTRSPPRIGPSSPIFDRLGALKAHQAVQCSFRSPRCSTDCLIEESYIAPPLTLLVVISVQVWQRGQVDSGFPAVHVVTVRSPEDFTVLPCSYVLDAGDADDNVRSMGYVYIASEFGMGDSGGQTRWLCAATSRWLLSPSTVASAAR